MLVPSPHCKAIIAEFESCAKVLPDGRVQSYPDPGTGGAPWTIGFGTTGPDVARGTIWTMAKCEQRFDADIARFGRDVVQLLRGKPTSQNQFDALVSFAYNVGSDIDTDTIAEGLGDSTLLRKHLAGDYAGAKAQFSAWNKAGGKVLNGLTRRRAMEAALYART